MAFKNLEEKVNFHTEDHGFGQIVVHKTLR